MKAPEPIPMQTLKRLPAYYNYLKSLPANSPENISAVTIARALGLNDVQVRKDLSAVSDGGKPKIGYMVRELMIDIGECLGCDDIASAVLVGAGNLGKALLNYDGFPKHGIDIVAAFDKSPSVYGTSVGGRQILNIDRLEDLCGRMKILIGIIAVPASQAQIVCDRLVSSGIIAIWNFARVSLKTPENVIVQNEDLGASLAALSNHLIKTIA